MPSSSLSWQHGRAGSSWGTRSTSSSSTGSDSTRSRSASGLDRYGRSGRDSAHCHAPYYRQAPQPEYAERLQKQVKDDIARLPRDLSEVREKERMRRWAESPDFWTHLDLRRILDLQKELGLPIDANIPLFGSITRRADQKGVDILLGALEEMLSADMQFVVLGSGDSGTHPMPRVSMTSAVAAAMTVAS